jgi:hypothetical protein
MLEPGDREFEELLELCQRATGPGLLPLQRNRWRELVASLLGKLTDAKSERRTSPRAKAELSVALTGPAEFRGLFTSTVSAGGLSVRMQPPLPVGTRVTLYIETQHRADPIRAAAEVVWSSAALGQMGLLFLDLLAPERELLEGIAVSHVLRAALG